MAPACISMGCLWKLRSAMLNNTQLHCGRWLRGPNPKHQRQAFYKQFPKVKTELLTAEIERASIWDYLSKNRRVTPSKITLGAFSVSDSPQAEHGSTATEIGGPARWDAQLETNETEVFDGSVYKAADAQQEQYPKGIFFDSFNTRIQQGPGFIDELYQKGIPAAGPCLEYGSTCPKPMSADLLEPAQVQGQVPCHETFVSPEFVTAALAMPDVYSTSSQCGTGNVTEMFAGTMHWSERVQAE